MIEGVRLVVTNRDVFDAGRFGVELAAALRFLYPGKIVFGANRTLIGSNSLVKGLEVGTAPEDLLRQEEESLTRFREMREKYLLYR
jgi:uncharacterized protein YbbC (DUF1343 family)